jgi:L-ectoine synthase
MLVRTLSESKTVNWGNGLSRRLLLEADGLGYTLTDTLVRAGSRSHLRYPHHLEACYCLAGTGWVIDGRECSHRIEPGTLYALDQHDAHCLLADPDEEMRLVCVFAPALEGDEVHQLEPGGYSAYRRSRRGHSLSGDGRVGGVARR